MKAKNIFLTLVCAAAIFSFTACGNAKDDATTPTTVSDNTAQDENVQIANPWVSCETLQEAEKNTGYSFEIPQNISRYARTYIQTLDKEITEVRYQNKEKVDDCIIIRKGVGTDDISGDYNEYKETDKTTVDKNEVVLKGNDGKIMLATWTSNGFAYSVCTPGMSKADTVKIIEQIK